MAKREYPRKKKLAIPPENNESAILFSYLNGLITGALGG
jgi:hypothetical protein